MPLREAKVPIETSTLGSAAELVRWAFQRSNPQTMVLYLSDQRRGCTHVSQVTKDSKEPVAGAPKS